MKFVVTILSILMGSGFASQKPNIILILADDLGYEALSANGSESCHSPNLDQLASSGLRFTNCFANPLCTPSRNKIMTGQSNVRNYVKFGSLDRGQTTFAHQLQKVGYQTCIAGKWQLGKEADSPQHFGFEHSCLWQHTRTGRSKKGSQTIDRRFVNPQLEINGVEKEFTNGEYGPQVCTDFICQFIEDHHQKPFMVYYPMILTHCPFDPTPDSKDWDPKRLGSSTYKGDQNDPQRHFRDMVAYADKMVGQILSQLEASGVRDHTLIIFTGDNGTDKPIVTPWKGRNVVGGKGTMTDEGTRVPLIVNWPHGVAKPGRVLDDLVEFSDFLPTLCEVGAAPLPDHYPGDGVSLLPVLKSEVGVRKKDWVYLWYQGQVMVRNQHYSLLAKRDGSDAQLIRYQGPFDGSKIGAQELTDQEKTLKSDFEKILRTRAKARLSGVDAQTRAKVGKAERGGKVIR